MRWRIPEDQRPPAKDEGEEKDTKTERNGKKCRVDRRMQKTLSKIFSISQGVDKEEGKNVTHIFEMKKF